ncbi:unnamed protein product (macronuclear) [Paramecium tetraurelia]|uniref:Uncharacterized protein n=1 Tax=Paramecium tetraurelia TaxID=5888 RepID=A0BP36_PARTE|nr:uncharacterized protein GSPATT00005052001 [Paramecium tetraurelia]CAK60303.1 unnamed protein product [Paramecium tetraurelia]|eukprot:XP_001427701.1 hypothetical protein (macronuclear) [Paramecium tetraurelia strain d4-2]
MQRVAPNTVKEAMARVVIPKQTSQPNICPEHNNFFHIPPKFQQQRLTIKQTMPTSKSIEEKRYKQHKNNISENNNNRTNSSSKSRVSAFATMQVEDDSLYGSQNGLKLRKIIGDSHILSSNILQQLYVYTLLYRSKQNLTSNLTSDSQSPGQRKPVKRNQELWNLNTQIQASLIHKKQFSRWEFHKEHLIKQQKNMQLYKQQFVSLSDLNDVQQQIMNNLFELFNSMCIQVLCEQEEKFYEMIDQIRREKDLWQNNYKQIEQERDILLETVKQLNTPKQIANNKNTQSNNVDSMDTIQLKEMQDVMQQKIQEMSEKEAKLIKLVLAIKKSGIDIEKIYNEEVLNDDSVAEQTEKSLVQKHQHYERSVHDADNSVINDSDESSFCFLNRFDNESIVESVRKFEYKNTNILDTKSNVKLKLDLSNIQKKNTSTQVNQKQQNQKQTIQQHQLKQMQKLKLPEHSDNVGFHQEFMQKLNEFSESWRIQALKDEKRTKS